MRTLRFTDWLLLIAGVLVMTLALGLVMSANAQTPPLTRNDVAPACRTYPQPEGCPALPWYELSYFIPLERQQQIVQQALPAIMTRLGDIQGAGNYQWPSGTRRCYEFNGPQAVEIHCASNAATARRSIRRPVRRLQRRSHR